MLVYKKETDMILSWYKAFNIMYK